MDVKHEGGINLIKKILAILILIIFIGICINPSIAIDNVRKSFILFSKGNTLYVGGSGEGNYTRIQDAIDNASNGDTVFVYNGIYWEKIVVDKSISLIGECRETTSLRGRGHADAVINITADWVNISGFSISGEHYCGIIICSDHNTITSNNIQEEIITGIEISSNFNNIIDNNISNYCRYGIYLSNYAFGNYIHGNNITGDDFYDFIHGISLSDNCNNNSISENIISDNYIDVYILSSFNNNICGNLISWDWYWGMLVESSSNNNIYNNHFFKNPHCLKLQYSNNNTIKHNNFLKTRCCTCISISNSSNNLISYNNVIRRKWGCCLSVEQYSSNNIIYNNKFSGGDTCIKIWYKSCSNNNIINNLISNSEYGIYIYNLSNSNNTIYHNNIINNSKKAYDACNNTWDNDYPSGGNYWDDYNGTDEDGDGLGDKPYLITGGKNSDRYPLMEPWGGNHPPDRPIMDGPLVKKPDEKYCITLSSTDPDGDDIFYYIDWGDGTYEEWVGPYESGENITICHTYPPITKLYELKVKVKDIYCAESGWGKMYVFILKSRFSNNFLFIRILERFPLLERLLSFLLL